MSQSVMEQAVKHFGAIGNQKQHQQEVLALAETRQLLRNEDWSEGQCMEPGNKDINTAMLLVPMSFKEYLVYGAWKHGYKLSKVIGFSAILRVPCFIIRT